jgi:hypothetical protein
MQPAGTIRRAASGPFKPFFGLSGSLMIRLRFSARALDRPSILILPHWEHLR